MSKSNATCTPEKGLILRGYQKKLKTMKKKFFVLYDNSSSESIARLEYHDNEKKFKSGIAPKRTIKLNDCFNINRRLGTKYNFVISLSTKEGAFGIVFDTESEMLKWLQELTELQRYSSKPIDGTHSYFDSVWQVTVQKKGIAEDKGLVGKYHICLTTRSIKFIRIGGENATHSDTRMSSVEFLLTTIRRCGDSQCIFYMEVGRQSVIGPGEIWMETEDSLTAENMHHTILNAMSAKTDSNIEPMRKRSSSANEASKPINVMQRRQTHSEIKSSHSPQATCGFSRERCDSLPTRNRTTSECSNQNFNASASTFNMRNGSNTPTTILSTIATALHNTVHIGTSGGPGNVIVGGGHRTHPTASAYQRHSHSPPVSSSSVLSTSETEETSMNVDETDDTSIFHPYRPHTYSRSSEGVIPEENTDELVSSESKTDDFCDDIPGMLDQSYVAMAPIRHFEDSDDSSIATNTQSTNAVQPNTSTLERSRVLEFGECTLDNRIKSQMQPHMEQRPTRTYSVGSKFEHNKLNNKRIVGSLTGKDITEHQQQQCNSSTSMRVRAFSVGSRAKIPRCDLQRDILFPKSYCLSTEHNNFFSSNSNNNIFAVVSADTAGCGGEYNQLLNINSAGGQQEKKSISAPLLIHKSQNSVDRMSDLMELDFSKSPKSNNSNTMNYLIAKQQLQQGRSFYNQNSPTAKHSLYLKSFPNGQRADVANINAGNRVRLDKDGSVDPICSPDQIDGATPTIELESSKKDGSGLTGVVELSSRSDNKSLNAERHQATTANASTATSVLLPSVASPTMATQQTDNGYLEMKPVGPQFNNKNTINAQNIEKQQQSILFLHQQQQQQQHPFQAHQQKPEKISPPKSLLGHDSAEAHLQPEEHIKSSDFAGQFTDNTKQKRTGQNLLAHFNQLSVNSNRNKTTTPPAAPAPNTAQAERGEIENVVDNYDVLTKDSVKYLKRPQSEFIKSNGGLANRLQHCTSSDTVLPSAVSRKVFDNKLITTTGHDAGYEILQIRSDSSLQAPKNCNRSTTAGLNKENTVNVLLHANPSDSTIANSVASSTHIHDVTGHLSNNAIGLDALQQNPLTNSSTSSGNNNSSTSPTSQSLGLMPSRPSSVSSDYELYYAHLDLPQCSTGDSLQLLKNGKQPKQTTSLLLPVSSQRPVDTSVVAHTPDVNNSYAKIDFDYSDSLLSSSSNNANI